MSEGRNTQLVKDAYAAFGRGDIAAILGMLDKDVSWQGVIGTEGVVPHAGVRHGRDGVAAFFEQLAGSIAFDSFEPREFVAEGDQVVAVGHYRARVKSTGKGVDSGWVMLFTIKDGKVTQFREYTDSAQLVKAYQ